MKKICEFNIMSLLCCGYWWPWRRRWVAVAEYDKDEGIGGRDGMRQKVKKRLGFEFFYEEVIVDSDGDEKEGEDVVKGDLKNLEERWIQKDNFQPEVKGLPISVFADDVVESSEVTTGVTKIGDYELHDLVLMDNNSFGVIIRVESEAFQVLKGADRTEFALVKLREIKCKVEQKSNAQDRWHNLISVKDVVRIVAGPWKGKQGPVEHIHRGFLFVYVRHHLEHAGFICAKANCCLVVEGPRANGDRYGDGRHRRGGGGGHDALVGTTVKIRKGSYEGCRGRVKDVNVKHNTVRVELESLMKFITVDRDSISDNVTVTPK